MGLMKYYLYSVTQIEGFMFSEIQQKSKALYLYSASQALEPWKKGRNNPGGRAAAPHLPCIRLFAWRLMAWTHRKANSWRFPLWDGPRFLGELQMFDLPLSSSNRSSRWWQQTVSGILDQSVVCLKSKMNCMGHFQTVTMLRENTSATLATVV